MDKVVVTASGREITYKVVRSARRTVSISISRQTGEVVLRVPSHVSDYQAQEFIEQKREWLDKHHNPKPKLDKYIDGSRHWILGEPRTLRVSIGRVNRIEFTDSEILIVATRAENVERILRQGYLLEAKKQLPLYIAKSVFEFERTHRRSPIDIEIKLAKTYWGLCTQRGLIRLNAELLRVRPELIEYVINHELCHLLQHNHSPKFYKLQEAITPNWAELRDELMAFERL